MPKHLLVLEDNTIIVIIHLPSAMIAAWDLWISSEKQYTHICVINIVLHDLYQTGSVLNNTSDSEHK